MTWSVEDRAEAAVASGEAQSLVVVSWDGDDLRVGVHGTMTPGGPPPTTRSLYQLGSVTKPYTAMAILRLVVEGSLSLETPVSNWLPDVRRCAGDVGSTLLVRHLISHCCGLVGDWFLDQDPGIDDGPDSLAEQVRRVPEVPVFAVPGERYSYSNLGVIIAGRLLEVVTGRGYEIAMHDLVLDPLGLTSTGFANDPGILKRTVPIHVRVDGTIRLGERQPQDTACPRIHRPSGGLSTSGDDFAAWLGCHLTAGRSTRQPELWGKVTALMREPQSLRFGPKANAVGLGWSIVSADPLVVRHGGGMLGFVASCAVAPAQGAAVGVLSNFEGSAVPVIDIERLWIERRLPGIYSPPPGRGTALEPDAYEGTFLVPPERIFSITRRNGRLWLSAGHNAPAGSGSELQLVEREWAVVVKDSPWPVVVPFELGRDGRAEWVTVGGRAARRIA